jgi:crossover junction endodeoxyribonuclease RusA
MRTLNFTVPGRPIVQERPIVLRRGWAIDPPRSKNEKKRIGQLCLKARADQKFEIIDTEVELYLNFYGLRPNADISNAVKLVEDALNKIAYLDDKQICRLEAERFTSFEGDPRTEVVMAVRPKKTPLQVELWAERVK